MFVLWQIGLGTRGLRSKSLLPKRSKFLCADRVFKCKNQQDQPPAIPRLSKYPKKNYNIEYTVIDGTALGSFGSIDLCLAATEAARRGVICAGFDSSKIYATIVATGAPIGGAMNFDICRESLKASQYSPICVPSMAGVYVIGRVGDGGTMEDGRSIGDCMTAIKAASNDSVCIGAGSVFAPARATDGAVLGDSVAVATCTAATKLGREGIICTQSEGLYFVTNISKKQRLGEMGDNQANCFEAVQSSRFNVACAQSSDGYAPMRTADGTFLGDEVPRSSCLKLTLGTQPNLVRTHKGGVYYPTRISDGQRLGLGKLLDQCLEMLRDQRTSPN